MLTIAHILNFLLMFALPIVLGLLARRLRTHWRLPLTPEQLAVLEAQ